MSTVAQTNRDLVVSAFEAAQAGKMDEFLGVLHPDVEVHEPPFLSYGGTYRGHDGFLDLFDKATQILDFPTLTLVSATADEERTVMLMTCNLISNGEQRYITEHWRVQDGLIREVRVFWFSLPD
jgi:ketosteroid isomerase-like protein